ncbi:MAG: rRNA maturation RNase YbeY [Candidatus Falkowbacteria bacterium]
MFVLEVNNQTQIKVDKKLLEGIIQICQKVLKIRKNQEISLAFVTPAVIKKMNLAYRGKNEVTDVLSFAGENNSTLGEIIICLARAKQQALAASRVRGQAKQSDRAMKSEVAKLLIHGYLHLLGHDHKTLSDARTMEQLERRIMFQNSDLKIH